MKVGEKDGSSRSQYVEKLLNLYLGLPETGCRTSRYDRQLAHQLYEQKVEIETIEVAMLLASARRIYRDPGRAPWDRFAPCTISYRWLRRF